VSGSKGEFCILIHLAYPGGTRYIFSLLPRSGKIMYNFSLLPRSGECECSFVARVSHDFRPYPLANEIFLEHIFKGLPPF
jgi:hypothetical protein